MPLSKAVIAVVALFYAVSYWNDFFNALLYLNDSSMWPLQLVLRLYVVQGAPLPSAGDVVENAPPLQSIQMAVVVVAMIPILCVYPFLQRYFTRGVLSGRHQGLEKLQEFRVAGVTLGFACETWYGTFVTTTPG